MDTLKKIVGSDVYSIIKEYSNTIIISRNTKNWPGGDIICNDFKMLIYLDRINSPCIHRNVTFTGYIYTIRDPLYNLKKTIKTHNTYNIYKYAYQLGSPEFIYYYLFNVTKQYVVSLNNEISYRSVDIQMDQLHKIHSDIIDYFQNPTNINDKNIFTLQFMEMENPDYECK